MQYFYITQPTETDDSLFYNPFIFLVAGTLDLLCGPGNMEVSMKIGVTWGIPSFEGEKHPCVFTSSDHLDTHQLCIFRCEPAPDFSEALFIFMSNYEINTTALIDVAFN